MTQARPLRKLVFLCSLLGATPAAAVTYRVDSAAGVMQQPTSHYYHLVYGGQVGFASDSERLIVRASYLERPAFKEGGFEDKDYGWFATIGTKISKKAKDHGVFAHVGAGQVAGYVKADGKATGLAKKETRGYALLGPAAALEYAARFGPLRASIGHQTFIGFVDRSEVEAFVAWPYNFFQTTLGVTW